MRSYQMPKLFILFALIALCLEISGAHAATPEPPSMPSQPVVDLAGIINPEAKTRLNEFLRTLEKKTGAEFVILTVASLDGEDIEPFTIRIAERWKLGKRGKDNGMLLAIALSEKKYRFETGYGLEGILPDSFLGTLGREQLRPFFRSGDYSTGLLNAATIIAERIAADRQVELGETLAITRPPPEKKYTETYSLDLTTILLLGVGVVLVFMVLSRMFRSARGHHSHDHHYGGWYTGGAGGGGGSFGGGSFGGGGGSFGGGGASGDW
ncbi:MAG: hypothetical protein FD164_261 [Nitrospirae bacterium]|nr:MAG: hypothetical protein FD164_261 [Nitrospirota bacterium]